ncbi:hypothetical protein D3C72_2278410 [compost metagenome]
MEETQQLDSHGQQRNGERKLQDQQGDDDLSGKHGRDFNRIRATSLPRAASRAWVAPPRALRAHLERPPIGLQARQPLLDVLQAQGGGQYVALKKHVGL